MIFTIPLTLVYFLLNLLLGLLPSSDGLPPAIQSAFVWLWGLLWQLDFVVPVSTLVSLLGLSLGFELAIQVWHFAHWVVRKIPMLNIR